MGCVFKVQHCLLVLACAFDCPLAASGAATSSLSRRMLVSDNSLSLKMTYALNLSSSHSIPAQRQGIVLYCDFIIHCSFQYVCTQAGHLFHCLITHCSLQHACTQAGHSLSCDFITVYHRMPAHKQGIYYIVLLQSVHYSMAATEILHCILYLIVCVQSPEAVRINSILDEDIPVRSTSSSPGLRPCCALNA